jgi:mediator of RNA polymerase II transcription subunit 31
MSRSHPGPTLRALELLQQERFRQDILAPGLMDRLVIEGQRNAVPTKKD